MKEALKEFYRDLMDTVYVHTLWIVVSLLGIFITFGAATTALFRVMFQIYNKEEPTHVAKLFFRTFKKEFWLTTCVWLLVLIFAIPLSFMLYYAVTHTIDYLVVIGIVAAFELTAFSLWIFPVISSFKTRSFLDLLKNVVLLQHGHFLTSLKLVGSLAIFVALMMYVHASFAIVCIPSFGFLMSFHLKKIFERYQASFKQIKGNEEHVV